MNTNTKNNGLKQPKAIVGQEVAFLAHKSGDLANLFGISGSLYAESLSVLRVTRNSVQSLWGNACSSVRFYCAAIGPAKAKIAFFVLWAKSISS